MRKTVHGTSHRRGRRLRVIFVSRVAVMQIRRDEKEWEEKKRRDGTKASGQLATSSLMKAVAAIQ